MDIVKILQERAKAHPDKAAVIFNGEIIPFALLKDRVFSLTGYMHKMGLNPGDKIALYLPNSPEYVYSYLAIWSLGLVAVPLDFMLTEEELIVCLAHGECKALILKPKANISLDNIKKSCLGLETIITCRQREENFVNFDGLLQRESLPLNRPVIKDSDYAIMFYTSGTTGKPKGVLINYKQLEAAPKSMGFFVNGDLGDKDTILCALPFSHLGGLIYILNTIVFGPAMVLMERFIPLEFLKRVEQYKVNAFWIVPSMYYAFLQLKEFETFNLQSLRWIVTFGASSSADALRRFNQFCPKAYLLNGWGLTETNAPTTVTPIGSKKIESVGRPPPWIEVKILNDSDKEMSPGAVGEIAVKGWVVTDGYYKDEEATRLAIRNGWFHTGDLGRYDEEGDLYIVGRKKEMIKVSGEIVFEPEVEAALYKHPSVSEAAVIGVSDRLRGEVPKAYVVIKQDKPVKEEELRYFLRDHLAHFKIPHYFEFRPTLPKNRTGKIDKAQLRETARN